MQRQENSDPPTERKSYLTERIACAETGWKFFERLKKEDEATSFGIRTAYLEVRYAYNPTLDTCVCGFERLFPDSNPSFSHFFIYDTLSGKMLANATTRAPETLQPFEERWREIMAVEREVDRLRGK